MNPPSAEDDMKPSGDALRLLERTNATDELISRVRDTARANLIRQHGERIDGYHNEHDPVAHAVHEHAIERLDPETPDDETTSAELDDELVRLLRETAANHEDPEIKDAATRALYRLSVPVEEPAVAKKAADAERKREAWATGVWHSFNGTAAPDLTKPARPAPISKADAIAAEFSAKRARMAALATDLSQPSDVRASARAYLQPPLTPTTRRRSTWQRS